MVRILSLNAWGGRVHERLIPYLATSDADVVCLQEMVHTPKTEAAWLVYRDHGVELPQRAKLYREVSAALPAHQGFFCPAARGDFNVPRASKTFEILGGLGLMELVTARGFTDTRTSFYAKPGRYADYMFVSPEVEVRHFDVVKSPEISDHRALVLDVS